MGRFDGMVAVVTGGASGIGLETARLITREGARVVVVDLDGERAKRVAHELGGLAVEADVGEVAQWRQIAGAAEELGGARLVHLNAGTTTGQEDLSLLDDRSYRRIMSVNIDGVVFGLRALLPQMVEKGGGAVAVTASLAGLIAFPADPVYTMTKHALVGLVRALAPRLEAEHIKVNAICPGLVDTPLIDGEVREAIIGTGFPLIAAEFVARAVVEALSGDESGQAIVVQAGRDPVAYRFGRPPGPRIEGAEGRVPPGWLADQSQKPGGAKP